jgi:sugar/nucleoside kinase (ribokinase family)
MKNILGMGNALVDILVRLDSDAILSELGIPRGSMQLVDLPLSRKILYRLGKLPKTVSAGGAAANTIHGLAKLGAKTGFIGVIGDDEIGQQFRNDMDSVGVRSHLVLGRQESGRAIVLVSPDSERTFATCLGAAVELEPHHLKLDLFHGCDLLYIEGYLVQNQELVRRAATQAKMNRMVVAIDLASFNVVEANKLFFREIISGYVDIVFANEEEAFALTGKPAREALDEISLMCRIAVVKTGPRGSLVKSDDRVFEIPAIPANPVDTTGAGDLYAAGFLYGLAKDLPLKQCGNLGALLAGNVIEVVGAKMDEARWCKILDQVTR